MFDVVQENFDWGGRPVTLETGRMARQADGAVLVGMGETFVLCTVVAARSVRPDQDFFPLTVHYIEKTFAAGKIPGGFFKREGRPSEKEVLTSRLIDRPIRPLFPKMFRNEVQVICTLLSHDLENNPDIVALIGTSAALTISGIPFLGPIGAVRVGYSEDGSYLLNPTTRELAESKLDLVVAGTSEGVLMVESEASELDEATMLGAVRFGHEAAQTAIGAIIRLAEKCARDPWDVPAPSSESKEVEKFLQEQFRSRFVAAYGEGQKQVRQEKLAELRVAAGAELSEHAPSDVRTALKSLEGDILRSAVLDTGKRIDGRDTTTIRQIRCEVGVLPRPHGSALFTRGETQALVVATLGSGQDEQIVDALDGDYRETFLLHYNFPPYSVGETGRVGSPGRREVGHGKLAWRALRPILPDRGSFPYTIRIVSEILESNGSSSMATVCGASLALMDAGVPLPRPVAGIAMGLIKDGDRFAVLSDILGDEDHLGDMDFKVAGTERGVTSLQMDIKITSITWEIMNVALEQAFAGRKHVLSEMASVMSSARGELRENAPRISTLTIPRDKIREVIGTGGRIIREICEETGAKIDIEDDGVVRVAAVDGEAAERAIAWIRNIVAEPEVGVIYRGKVVKVVDFGAFVNFLGSRDGLVHISELAKRRVGKVTDVVNVDDEIYVQCIGLDDRGKVKLSMRRVDQESGEAAREEAAAGQGAHVE